MNPVDLAFIGGGNMAQSLIGGLLAAGYPAPRIRVGEPDAGTRALLVERFGVAAYEDNGAAAAGAAVWLFAVKPQAMRAVATALTPQAQSARPQIISIAAGIRNADLDAFLGGGLSIVRCMPNTPALVRSGATGLFANAAASPAARDRAEFILRAVGLTAWLTDEDQLDAVTALSGSGPAYFFRLMELMETAGIAQGLAPETARLLTLQTALGAAKMALESQLPPGTLRARVTSPGGTTEQALAVFEQGGLAALVSRALDAARARSVELSRLLGTG